MAPKAFSYSRFRGVLEARLGDEWVVLRIQHANDLLCALSAEIIIAGNEAAKEPAAELMRAILAHEAHRREPRERDRLERIDALNADREAVQPIIQGEH